jgi:hypothetical protein
MNHLVQYLLSAWTRRKSASVMVPVVTAAMLGAAGAVGVSVATVVPAIAAAPTNTSNVVLGADAEKAPDAPAGVDLFEPVPIQNHDGRLEVFAFGSNHALWHNWQVTANAGWHGWESLGGPFTQEPRFIQPPAVEMNADGRLEVFGAGPYGTIWHNWQVKPGAGWSGWYSLPQPPDGPQNPLLSVGRNADGRLELFTSGARNELVHMWQVVPNGGWSGWSSLGGYLSDWPTVGRNQDGRLEVYARGNDLAVHHIYQLKAGGAWSGWDLLGSNVRSLVTAATNTDGRLELFAVSAAQDLVHDWQSAPNSSWSGWASLGGQFRSVRPAAGLNSKPGDGRLEVFAVDLNGSLVHRWQVSAGRGWNNEWVTLGAGPFTTSPHVASNKDYRLEVFVGSGGHIYHRYQTSAGGDWGLWSEL